MFFRRGAGAFVVVGGFAVERGICGERKGGGVLGCCGVGWRSGLWVEKRDAHSGVWNIEAEGLMVGLLDMGMIFGWGFSWALIWAKIRMLYLFLIEVKGSLFWGRNIINHLSKSK